MMDRFNIDSEVGKLAVWTRAGKGPVLLFLHGAGFSSAVFSDLFQDPSYDDFHLVATDLPGHGRSAKAKNPAKTYTFSGLAKAVSSVLKTLDLDEVIVVGWSLGGHVALDMLETNDRVAGAFIFGTPLLTAGALSTLRAFHLSRDMLLGSKGEFTLDQAARFERLCLGEATQGRYTDDLMSVDPAFRPSISRSIFHGQNGNQKAVAQNTRKPVCVVYSDDDPIVHAGYMAGLSREIDTCDFKLIKAGGHAPFVLAADAFTERLTAFSALFSAKTQADDTAASQPIAA